MDKWLSATYFQPGQSIRSKLVNATVQTVWDVGWNGSYLACMAFLQARQVSDFKNHARLVFKNWEKFIKALPDKGKIGLCFHILANYELLPLFVQLSCITSKDI